MKNYKEYKETTPENTINIIRSILNDLDLLLLCIFRGIPVHFLAAY